MPGCGRTQFVSLCAFDNLVAAVVGGTCKYDNAVPQRIKCYNAYVGSYSSWCWCYEWASLVD